MGIHKVTQEQWIAVMGSNPSHFHGGTDGEPFEGEIQGKRPVEMVSWYDAIVFCNRLSIQEGLNPAYTISGSTDPDMWIAANGGTIPTISNAIWNAVEIIPGSNGYRLPTEAQWEYSAKGGHLSESFAFSGGDNPDAVGRHSGNSNGRTRQDGLRQEANGLGLHDMNGNVWEWCWDWFGPYSAIPSGPNPTGPSSGSFRVIRGEIWNSTVASLRSASRGSGNPGLRDYGLGFRVVRL
jgi:formylglycine-generating enzyme required for sulfatase activity